MPKPPSKDPTGEAARLELERLRTELAIKQAELRQKHSMWRRLTTDPIFIGAVITATITANATIVGLIGEARKERLEMRKWQSDLILNSISDDATRTGESLLLLVETGFIDDPQLRRGVASYVERRARRAAAELEAKQIPPASPAAGTRQSE